VVEKFTVSTDKQTWKGARDECKKLGMDLASLETFKEFQCAADKIALAGKNLYKLVRRTIKYKLSNI